MKEAHVKKLQTILSDPKQYSELAAEVGRLMVEDNPVDVYDWLRVSLKEELGRNSLLSGIDRTKTFKLIMALCILIACQGDDKSQENYLQQFLADFASTSRHDIANFFVLCELSYLDQFLSGLPQRQSLYNAIVDRFKKFSASPPFLDYFFAWRVVAEIDKLLKKEPDKPRSKMEVVIIGSIKGGVGKTITTVALANYLCTARKARVALVDFDVSGPTLQYNLNVRSVSDALKPKVNGWDWSKSSKWVYPTFLDLVSHPLFASDRTSETLPSKIPLDATDIKGEPSRLSVVLLPDSLTVTGIYVASRYFNTLERVDVLQAAEKIFTHLGRHYDYAIIDMGPGLFGTNGTLITWMVENYNASFILLSSPRMFGVANSMYEGSWLSAKGYLPWKRNILQLLNMWPVDGDDVNTLMSRSINKCLSTILHNGDDEKQGLSSADFISFWRLRSFLYKIAIDTVEGNMPRSDSQINKLRYEIKTLPYDEDLRTIMYPNEDPNEEKLGALDFADMRTKKWYLKFKGIMDDWLV